MNQPTPQTAKPQPKRQFGAVNYDVPTHMRQLYPKLRALFKRRAIMQTQSAYLFPWALAQDVDDGIREINMLDGFPRPARDQVRYSIFKFDEEVSGKALTESCRDAVRKSLSRMKTLIHKKLSDIEKLANGVEVDNPELDIDDAIRTAKVSCRRAKAILKDMQAVAMIFDLTDDMDAAFVNYAAWVETKKDIIMDHEKEMQESSIPEGPEDNDIMENLGDPQPSGGKTFNAPVPTNVPTNMDDCPV